MYPKFISILLAILSCLGLTGQIEPFFSNGRSQLGDVTIYRLKENTQVFQEFRNNQSEEFNLTIPLGPHGMQTINLKKSLTFSNDIVLNERSANGSRPISKLNGSYFIGEVEGEKNSLVSINISDQGLTGIISFRQQNWNLEKQRTSGDYILYHDDNLRLDEARFCDSDEGVIELEAIPSEVTQKNKLKGLTMSSVDLYIECDYEMYLDFNSDLDATLNYAASLLSTVNGIFNSSNINLNISQIDVWTTPDPYDANNADSSGDVLNAFKCELDGVYNGRIAHLLSTTNQFGGIANRRDRCPYEEPLYGFSRIFTSFSTDLNVYSWSVNVIAHELGHSLSSPHTHTCNWNGNGTQIDDCANVYSTSNNNDTDCDGVIDNIEEAEGGDCFDMNNPIIPPKGTIMSYCHVSGGNGIDLAQGFHPQVATKMKEYIDNCLSPSIINYCPMPAISDLTVTVAGPNELLLICNLTNGIDGYAWSIKPDLPCATSEVISGTQNVTLYQDVLANTTYYVKCLLNCDSGPEWGEWSCEIELTTPPCFSSLTIAGLQSNVVKTEQAALFIHSTEVIRDASEIHYLHGGETSLQRGFEVEKASELYVDTLSCL